MEHKDAQDSMDSVESVDTLSLGDQPHTETPISIDFGSLTLSPLTLSESSNTIQQTSVPPSSDPSSTFSSTPTFLRRRSLAPSSYFSRPSVSLSRRRSSKMPNLNKPLPEVQSTPSYMQVTPPHLRRHGHSTTQNPSSAQSLKGDKRSSFLPKFGATFQGKSKTAAPCKSKTTTQTANITVAVRVRPVPISKVDSKFVPTYLLTSTSSRPCLLIESRKHGGHESVLDKQPLPSESSAASSKNIFVTVPQSTPEGTSFTDTTRCFSSFDYVFSDITTQKHMYYSCVEPLIASVLHSGTDLSLIAYGQARSGKSYTLGTAILNETMIEKLDFGGKFSEEVFRGMGNDDSMDVHGLENEDGKGREGILIRALDDIFAKAATTVQSVAVSYVEIGTRTRPAGPEEIAFDLLRNQQILANDIDAEQLWGAVAKVSVTSTEEILRTLLEAKRNRAFSETSRHMLIGIEIGTEIGKKSRLIFMDSFGSEKISGNSDILNDVRFLSAQTLIFATVSAQPSDATETLATLLVAERAMGAQNAETENKPSSTKRKNKTPEGGKPSNNEVSTREKSQHNGSNIEELRSRIHALEIENLRLKRDSISSDEMTVAHQKSKDQGEEEDRVQQLQSDVSVLRSLLKDERLSYSKLEHRLANAESELTLAQQATEHAVQLERSTRLDLCALKGCLISISRERDAGQMELRKAKACEEAARDKWLTLESECEVLKLVIADIERRDESPESLKQEVSLEEGSVATLNSEEPPFVDILTSLANRLASSQRLTEKLQNELEEQQAISAKVKRRAEKEQRLKEKFMEKLILRAGHLDGMTGDLNDDGDQEEEGKVVESYARLDDGTAISRIFPIYRGATHSGPSEDYLKLLDSRIMASSGISEPID